MAADESSDVHIKVKKKRMQQSGSINEESTEDNVESAPSTSKGTLSTKMRALLLFALNSASVQQQPSSSGLPTPGGSGASRRRGTLEEADYLIGPHKSVHRRRADPRVSMASVLHDIFTDLKG
uniref:Uncharacterized protein n=1 Tax=Ditylenchus dipsaci TaxID=166011 RepID=A0A915E097_9BILA